MEKENKTMREQIIEEMNSRPRLTDQELKELMYFPTEDEIRKDEEMTERICERIERLIAETNGNCSDEQVREIMLEENKKRDLEQ